MRGPNCSHKALRHAGSKAAHAQAVQPRAGFNNATFASCTQRWGAAPSLSVTSCT